MSKAVDRMRLSEAILGLIAQQRVESGDLQLGDDVEAFLIDTHFRDLETEILQNPGAFEPWLVRRNRHEN